MTKQELQDRLDLLEVEREGMRELQNDHMRELEAKGYEVVRHKPDGPCYLCTIARVVDGLPRWGA